MQVIFFNNSQNKRSECVQRDIVNIEGFNHSFTMAMVNYGYHFSIQKGYNDAIETAINLDAKSVQLFTGNKQSYATTMVEPKIYKIINMVIKDYDIFLINHSALILNFARPLYEESKGSSALNRYLKDLINITNLGGLGSVLHMGSNVKDLNIDMKQAYKNFANNLKWIIERKPVNAIIILENMAGGGTQMCCKMADWADFWNNYIDDESKKHIKWCVDTAHLYACGEYDLSKCTEILRFYKDFNTNIGWDNIACFHFNGSKTKLGSKKDQHADIGPKNSGYIETKGLCKLAKIACKTNKPIILEVPCDEYSINDQFDVIRSWFK